MLTDPASGIEYDTVVSCTCVDDTEYDTVVQAADTAD
ncbi:hypothetical protein J2S69_001137 [Glycomyces lechevalierae]|uniref:Uncharacterized protein n=1 Tax=Glycomyces lechevalierae TaxID=256034 RepID=A0ABU2AJM7_9ACTN|nr:hypothetical protein [Glycomyces lechevalierae]